MEKESKIITLQEWVEESYQTTAGDMPTAKWAALAKELRKKRIKDICELTEKGEATINNAMKGKAYFTRLEREAIVKMIGKPILFTFKEQNIVTTP